MFSHLYKPLIGSALIHTHFVSYVRDLIGMESLPLSEQCVVCVERNQKEISSHRLCLANLMPM